VLDVPRSVVLAAWAGAALAGAASVRDAVRAVTGTDEPHAVSGDPAGAGDLAALLAALPPTATVRAVLPAPGDPTGLAGPPAFNAEAVDAGEAVLLTGPGATGLVPEVAVFGSAWEPGATVTWHAHAANAPAAPEAMTLADAQRALRTATAEATRALADLDVARWREEAADRIVAVRDGALRTAAFPPGTSAEALAVATSAARVRAIVALATEDDGAAITGHEATSRTRSLREVDAVARRALAVAASQGGAGRGGQRASAAR
jgi:hypothetical protein